jgi:hypothetical protein
MLLKRTHEPGCILPRGNCEPHRRTTCDRELAGVRYEAESLFTVIVGLDATTKGPSPLVGKSKVSREARCPASKIIILCLHVFYIQIINFFFNIKHKIINIIKILTLIFKLNKIYLVYNIIIKNNK